MPSNRRMIAIDHTPLQRKEIRNIRFRLLEIHNTLNIKIELINEKNRKSTKHQKSNKCGTISRCNDSNFLHSLQYMYSTIYTYMAHLLSSKTEKIGKNSDLNELHCRTFIASKTWLRIFIALEFLPTFFTVWLHIRVELLAFLASQYSFYGDTLHCKRLQCFPAFINDDLFLHYSL